jgi:hypothetical protein
MVHERLHCSHVCSSLIVEVREIDSEREREREEESEGEREVEGRARVWIQISVLVHGGVSYSQALYTRTMFNRGYLLWKILKIMDKNICEKVSRLLILQKK